jgi:hypothetical protein
MSRTVPNHPALLLSSSGPSGHCYQLVGLVVADGVGVGVGVGVGDGDGLGDADGEALGDADADVAAAVGVGFEDDLMGVVVVWCFEGFGEAPVIVEMAVGEASFDLLTAGPDEAGVVASCTEVWLGSPVVLPRRLPLR